MQDKLVKFSKIALKYLKRYSIMAGLAVVVAAFALAVFRIESASKAERDEDYYNQLLTQVKVIKFDEETIEEIRNLRDATQTVQSRFPNNRNNPF